MYPCVLAAIINHLLNMIISQVMLINRSRLATYANHASVAHVVYHLTFFHAYKLSMSFKYTQCKPSQCLGFTFEHSE
jgi:hypothetical protein